MNNKVVIITLNYNQNQYTIECVNSLILSDYINYSILIVDNGSTESNYTELKNKLPKDYRIELYRIEKNRGYTGGINYGLEKGLKYFADYYLIMNNDTRIDKYSIHELVRTCKKYNDKAIVTGKVYYYDEPLKIQDVGYYYENKNFLRTKIIGLNEIDNGQYDEEKTRDMIDDIFWLFPTNLYLKIGGYSNYFWFNNEQADFALKAQKKGYKLIYTPNAKLWHKGSASIGGRERNPVLVYWSIQSSLIYRYLHLKKIYFAAYFLMFVLSLIKFYLRNLFIKQNSKKIKLVAAKTKAMLYFIKWVIIRNYNDGINPFIETRNE